jgi:hypothetical protein
MILPKMIKTVNGSSVYPKLLRVCKLVAILAILALLAKAL